MQKKKKNFTSSAVQITFHVFLTDPVNMLNYPGDYVTACDAGLAHPVAGMPASLAASFATALLCMAQTLTTNILQKHDASDTETDRQNHAGITVAGLTAAEDALLAGCCVLQSTACLYLVTEQQQQQQQQTKQLSLEQQTAVLLSKAVSQLRGLLVASKHGKLTGAAAAALGSLLNSALMAQLPEPQPQSGSAATEQTNKGLVQHAHCGIPADLNESELRGGESELRVGEAELRGGESKLRVGVSDLLAAGDQVVKLPSAAMGKQGVAMGLSALLGGIVGPHSRAAGSGLLTKTGWSQETQDVLEVRSRLSMAICPHQMLKCWCIEAAGNPLPRRVMQRVWMH